jgi:hypothetical protein
VTSIGLRAYVLALPGMIPGVIAYTFLGATAGGVSATAEGGRDHHATKQQKAVNLALVVSGAVFAVSGGGLVVISCDPSEGGRKVDACWCLRHDPGRAICSSNMLNVALLLLPPSGQIKADARLW